MNLQTRVAEAQDDADRVRLQERFDGEIKDASLPAEQILTEQKEAHETNGNVQLFVP